MLVKKSFNTGSASGNDVVTTPRRSTSKKTNPLNTPFIYGPSKLNSAGYSDYNNYLRDLSIENTAREFKFNESEAQKARDFQEEMSNTSHQREVEDLKKAGLNPVLSANSGATAYSASSASASGDDPTGAMASLMMNKMNNANAVKIAKMQNSNNLKIAKLSASANLAGSLAAASASRYASDNAYLASIYGTDHSKYGFYDKIIGALFGDDTSTNTGKTIQKGKGIGKKILDASPRNPANYRKFKKK